MANFVNSAFRIDNRDAPSGQSVPVLALSRLLLSGKKAGCLLRPGTVSDVLLKY